MAPCVPWFLLQSTGEDSSPMMKTILQKIRVELAILGKKKDNSPMFPRLDLQMPKILRCVKRTLKDCFYFFRKRRAIRLLFFTVVRTDYS